MSATPSLCLLLKFLIISLFSTTCLSKVIHIDITNRLPTNEIPLIVNCKSMDDDLGYHKLGINQLYAWSFNDNIMETTFYCKFWHNQKNAIFTVFSRLTLCNDNTETCYYEARADGFYFSKTNATNSWEKSFVVKVDPTVAWESIMAKILKKTKLEITSLKMHGEGMFQVSGALDPKLLLKVLGKTDRTAYLVGLQSGGCSQNLYMPEFEQRQRYKQYLKDGAEMQAYYNDFCQRYSGGYGQGYYGYNNGNGYVRNNGHAQYLH